MLCFITHKRQLVTTNYTIIWLFSITCLPTILNYLKREGAIILCRILAPPPPNAPSPSPTPQYLTILMTERGAPLSFVRFWRPPPPPPMPPSPDATLLNYLNDRREEAPFFM